ncbi:MAG: VWA domain-containing protein [Gammaproteobacteria bacterium]|nr:MAG: VWA domain-containing protein [Gammaproteobacteria bacterium]
MMEQFHFLRPWWLLALIPLIVFSVMLLRRSLFSRNWQSIIDPQLLPHVLIGKPGTQSRWPALLFFIAGLLGVIALAGPVWQQLPQPVFKAKSALVIALDLSRSMDASDIKPSRLTRAHYKVNDILKLRKEGDTALIAYAADAFTAIPLTDDTDTIANIVNSLTTDIMPAQGSRADRALLKAEELLTNAAIHRGHILLVTDGIAADELDAFNDIARKGHHVSILGIGTEAGSPISLGGSGFLQDNGGNIVIAKTDVSLLRQAASQGNGRFSMLTTDDSDIKHLLSFVNEDIRDDDSEKTELASDTWQEQGPWLLLLLAPMAALAFRRGALLILLVMLLPLPQPAQAMSWDELWKNNNQRAAEKLNNDQAAEAAELFSDQQWKAAAHYKAQQYENTLNELDGIDSAYAHYNRGNALARLGRYEEAIDAYDQALKIQSDLDDARYNKQQVEDFLKQQQQKQQQDKQQSDQENKQQGQDQEQSSSHQNAGSDSDNKEQASNQQKSQSESGKNKDGKSGPAKQAQQQNSDDAEQQDAQQAEQKNESEQTAEQQQMTQQESDNDMKQALSQQATEQWLRKIPDDPGGLLRRKFLYQYRNMQGNQEQEQPW